VRADPSSDLDGDTQGSAERAVDGDVVQCVLENGEPAFVELADEELRYGAQVDQAHLGAARHAGVGTHDEASSTRRATRRVVPDREMSARSERSVMRNSPPACAS
jgi:hypothetical protein